jgi:hypothetical protein
LNTANLKALWPTFRGHRPRSAHTYNCCVRSIWRRTSPSVSRLAFPTLARPVDSLPVVHRPRLTHPKRLLYHLPTNSILPGSACRLLTSRPQTSPMHPKGPAGHFQGPQTALRASTTFSRGHPIACRKHVPPAKPIAKAIL